MTKYLFKVKLNLSKTIFTGWTAIHGIGLYHCRKIQAFLGIKSNYKLINLSSSDFFMVQQYILKTIKKFELELFRFEYYNIQNLLKTKSYKGLCHKLGRPVRGQRTHTNASTQSRLFSKRLKLRKW